MRVFQVILGICAIIAGVFSMLGIWFPGLRGVYGGVLSGRAPKGYRGQVPVGALSCTASSLIFTSIGLMFLFGRAMPKPLAVGLVVCVFIGFFLTIAGSLFDSRAHDIERGAYRLPQEMRTGTPAERQRWIFAACVALILIVMILALVFHG
jgi:hypothetical protein